jgi:hypothetical protein
MIPAARAPRFHFKIDPKTPVKDLLPQSPEVRHPVGPLQTDDLTQVPEVRFQRARTKDLPKGKGMEQTAHAIAKINHLNAKETDGFLKALLADRSDLAGLSFAMGDACRTTGERSRQFKLAVAVVRSVLQQAQGANPAPAVPVISGITSFSAGSTFTVPAEVIPQTPPPPPPAPKPSAPRPAPTASASVTQVPVSVPVDNGAASPNVIREVVREVVQVAGAVPPATANRDAADTFWDQYRDACAQEDSNAERRDRAFRETVALARVAALMQVLAPESPGLRLGLVRYLEGVSHAEATRALAKLVLFSAEDEVRRAAIDALQVRRERDYTPILLEGFRYPLPAVAKRAAEALVKLERKDLIPQLVGLLDEPDPRVPQVQEVDGKKVPVVRELVRLNHHHSCLLCHAPGNTSTVSPEALTASVPIPDEPLPPPSQGYNNPSIPDILVRVDVTYLRQDFSALMPVVDANPWPEMQRFDFLVRRRTLTEEEAKTYQEKLSSREPGFVPPHRREALAALRELTGRDTEPTSQAWRKLLGLADSAPLEGAE